MILFVSLSPAWQRTLTFDRLVLGEVCRASRVVETASGKGTNAARVAKQLGGDVLLLTTLGGVRGKLLAQSLKKQQLRLRVVPVAAETRLCQTLLGGGTATELVEETQPLSQREVASVLQTFERELPHAKILVLIGTVPRGCGADSRRPSEHRLDYALRAGTAW